MDHYPHQLVSWIERYKKGVPRWLVRVYQKYGASVDFSRALWIAQDPFPHIPSASSYDSEYPYKIGIIKEFCHMHSSYMAACQDLGVSYVVVDISGPDWLEEVEHSGCDAFLVRPSGL